ncbi:ImmA/IrrE family metallo-endopeptidase [Enterococcus faecalis]|uniref:ImmA/IrrE family metallo-endopeptidase n=1 Tax=Enterococcus faecalis TaxID=1351 RepID=UPI000CF255A2|nr:ImmA/IrrE family metallo-endopeptidase [Enterococcus faecalis]EKZ0400724.1 ImmA/IrrE family metallo-endopeptidase [Enterococcus faecalis]PQF86293.1 Zn peptidase [Enterococcus faecalis]PQG73872.1 Zn peptidase [Enterococcus faecalis]UDM44312.1 ImmA/IrrE family metallo-endopeptidase [Enterococcus faecalis]
MENLKYKDIYTQEFLSQFGDQSTCIGELELNLNEDPSIDVRHIAEILGIEIEEMIMIDSGKYDSENNKISVNSIEPECRQRFTIAHEMGHAILGHEGISYRSEVLDKYKETIKKSREVMANKFAAELLMPRKLLFKVVFAFIDNKGWNNKSLDLSQVDEIIEECAKKLKVSKISLNYAVKNNEIFVSKS